MLPYYSLFNQHDLAKGDTKNVSRVLLVGVILAGAYFNAKYIYSAFSIDCESITV